MRAVQKPEVQVTTSRESGSQIVADMIRNLVSSNPECVLGLATGGTPTAVYDLLIRQQTSDPVDWKKVTTFNLDEYVGLTAEEPQSFHAFMNEHLFRGLKLTDEQTHLPPGISDDFHAAAQSYEDLIRSHGGIDWQLLGIGDNGHIAFNEPGSALDSRTRLVDLTPETLDANARFFESPQDVPRRAITMGIGTIMEAKKVVLLAFGGHKAEAVQASVEGPVTTDCPASFLQLHPNVTFVLDEDAASRLTR